jgi:predicted acyl esterase
MSSSFVTHVPGDDRDDLGTHQQALAQPARRRVRELLREPHVHGKFATTNGDAAMAGLLLLLNLHHDPHPWGDLWRAIAVEHPVRDDWRDERSLVPLLDRVQVPVYLGCYWQNVPLHLPGTLASIGALPNSPHVRVAMLGEHGISWPWESLHVETLAWYDHWLKGRDTGVLDGPPVRYQAYQAEAGG